MKIVWMKNPALGITKPVAVDESSFRKVWRKRAWVECEAPPNPRTKTSPIVEEEMVIAPPKRGRRTRPVEIPMTDPEPQAPEPEVPEPEPEESPDPDED